MYCVLTLHPIMFLLNHLTHYLVIYKVVPLHPIMFLLNLGNEFTPAKKEIFTSHYVPIKSKLCHRNKISFYPLYIPLCSY